MNCAFICKYSQIIAGTFRFYNACAATMDPNSCSMNSTFSRVCLRAVSASRYAFAGSILSTQYLQQSCQQLRHFAFRRTSMSRLMRPRSRLSGRTADIGLRQDRCPWIMCFAPQVTRRISDMASNSLSPNLSSHGVIASSFLKRKPLYRNRNSFASSWI